MIIDSFTGANRFLSNFYPCLVRYKDDPLSYPSVEHAYQAQKTLNVNDQIIVCKCKTPAEAKKLGRKLKMRHDWDKVKVDIMRDLLRFKFGQGDLLQKLLATGDTELIEGNWWGDRFWGVCNGVGENMLGKLLMQVRAEYQTAISGVNR